MSKKNMLSTESKGKFITDVFTDPDGKTKIYFCQKFQDVVSEYALDSKETEDKFRTLVVDAMLLTDTLPPSLRRYMDGSSAEEDREIALEPANHELSFIDYIIPALTNASYKLCEELKLVPDNTANDERTFFLLNDAKYQAFSIPSISNNVVLAYSVQTYPSDPRNEYSYSTVRWAVFNDLDTYHTFVEGIMQAALICEHCKASFCFNDKVWEDLEDSESLLDDLPVVHMESKDEVMDKDNTLYVEDHPEVHGAVLVHCPACHKCMTCV